jgi:hypothetical protein
VPLNVLGALDRQNEIAKAEYPSHCPKTRNDFSFSLEKPEQAQRNNKSENNEAENAGLVCPERLKAREITFARERHDKDEIDILPECSLVEIRMHDGTCDQQ